MTPSKPWNLANIIGFLKSVDKKTWVRVAVTALGVIILWGVLIGPAWIERPMLRHDIQEMTTQIRQVNALNLKRPILEKNLTVYNDILTHARGRLFTSEGIALLLGQISKLADASSVEVLASGPYNEKVPYAAPYNAKYSAIGYEFTVQGGYHDLGKLAGRIESYDHLLRVQRLKISSSDKSPEKHKAELRVLAFTEAAPIPLTKVTDAKKYR